MPSITRIEWTFDQPQTEIRLRPLREHWEARGPGMLRHACNQLSWIRFPESVRVHLVEPTGCGGRLRDGFVEFDAVLANPFPILPEVVRLAWLLLCQAAQANHQARLGLVTVTIEAAEFVELAKCEVATIELALKEWLQRPTISGQELLEWWMGNRAEAVLGPNRWTEKVDLLVVE